MQINSKLAHLSTEQLVDLLEQYDDQSIPLKDIISKFSIQTTPSALNALLPLLIHEEASCPYCTDVLLQSRRPNRSGYTFNNRHCPNCGHQDTDYCNCQNCRETAAKEHQWIEEIKRKVIREDYGGRHCDDDVESLMGTVVLELRH